MSDQKEIKDSPSSFDHTIRPVKQRFKLSEETRNLIKQGIPKFGFNGLGEVVFRRTYSRGGESWHDVVIRVIEGVMSIRKEHFYRASLRWNDNDWQDFARDMALSMFKMEWLPPGRGLWMMGTEFVYTRGGMALNNCAATDTTDDIVLSAEWTMDGLMNGVGVGFNTSWRGEAEFPDKEDKEVFVIPDSREGWVHSLIKLMCAYINSPRYGKNKFPEFNYSVIRPAGEPIKGFGGQASGPEPLRKMHERIEGYLDCFCKGYIVVGEEEKLYNHTRLVADIFNAIGACVVAGNVRRCKPENTLVFTRLGLKNIQDVNEGEEVLTGSGYSKVTENLHQGEQKLLRIKTQIGDSWCTPEHRMAVLTSPETYEWKYAKDLEPWDHLVFPTEVIEGTETHLPEHENIDSKRVSDITIPELDEDVAWFFGYFHGNGNVYIRRGKGEICTSLPSKYPKIIEKAKIETERFGVTTSRKEQGNCTRIKAYNKNLGLYFSQFKKSWADINVPQFILEGTPEIRGAYLAGLFDADGTFRQSIKRLNVILTSSSPSFLTQLQSVYASLGIPVRHRLIRKARKSTHKDTYELHVIGKYSKVRWQELVGCHSLKYQPYTYKNHTRYEEDYHYPRFWFDGVETKKGSGYKIKSNFMSVDEYVDRFEEYPPFIPVRVLGTEMTDECVPTFDLSVENEHEYFCGEGLLNHNSAEICLGDVEDKTFINLKNYDENPERGEIGWMSNNSVVLQADHDYEDFSYIPDMASRISDNGEPGMINLYNIQKYGRFGKEMKDEASLVNPCFSGDTLIAVADGRGCVSIRELAAESKDVPVYSVDPVSGEISVKWGRHPRVTGTGKQLLRIHFGGKNKGEYMDVTPNHKFILNDGREVRADELEVGDSLPKFKKTQFSDDYVRVYLGLRKYRVEHRMIKEFLEKDKFYKNYEHGVYNGCCRTNGVVVHHKDNDKTNNRPDNLEIITAGDHNRIHNLEYVGKGNPMYGKNHREETKLLIGQKAKERCRDPKYRLKLSVAQTPEIREKNSKKMKIQKEIWDTQTCDKQEEEALRVGLRIKRLSPTKLRVVRVCENTSCCKEFQVKWTKREQAYCSTACSNTKKASIEARKRGQTVTFEGKAKENFHKQAMIYKDLEEAGQQVMKKKWVEACKQQGISVRFNPKSQNPWIAGNWKEFKQMVIDYNHRVSYVEELDGEHTVYNITVDDNHTLAVVTKTKNNNLNLFGVFTRQCGEIPLENYELCNLAETFPPRCDNVERFYEALRFATFYSSTVSLLPTHRPETNAVIAKNRRIGISVSGVAQWASGCVPDGWGNMNYTRMTKYLRDGYKIVRDENTRLAERAGVPASVRITTVKPSGSISLLAGVTPGVHYPVSRFAIRRMRIGEDSPLVQPLKDAGIKWEKDTYSDRTLVFEFVIDHGVVRPCEEVSPWEQFSLMAMIQRAYSDNCVSCTVYFDKEKDGPDVEKMLAMYIPVLKSVSMLPHSGHNYKQAPYEPIDRETYLRRRGEYTILNFNSVKGNVPVGSKYCTGDKCEFIPPTREDSEKTE